MLVKTEGDVGSVSRYTEIEGSDGGKDVMFNVATRKGSSRLSNFGMGVDSIEISPCFERRNRICCAMSLIMKTTQLSPSAPCRVGSDPCLQKPHHNDSRESEA